MRTKIFWCALTIPLFMIRPDAGNSEKIRLRKLVARASSTLVSPDKPKNYYGPEKAADGSKDSAWCAGGKKDGIGEWIEIEFDPYSRKKEARTEWDRLFVIPGVSRSQSLYLKNNQIKGYRAELTFSNGRTRTVIGEFKGNVCLNDDACSRQYEGRQCIRECRTDGFEIPTEFGRLLRLQKIRLTILSVSPGKKYRDTCVSEIYIRWIGTNE